MSEDHEEAAGGAQSEGYRFLISDLGWTVVGWAAGMCEVTAMALRNTQGTLAGHINLTRRRDEFARSAALEIERITNQED